MNNKGEHLKNLTDEQRVEMRLKSAESKRVAIEYAQNNLCLSYKDEPFWEETARSLSVRLPQSHFPISDIKYMRRLANKLNFDIDIFVQETGFKGLIQFAEANPTFTARAGCGILLECYLDYKKNELLQLD